MLFRNVCLFNGSSGMVSIMFEIVRARLVLKVCIRACSRNCTKYETCASCACFIVCAFPTLSCKKESEHDQEIP